MTMLKALLPQVSQLKQIDFKKRDLKKTQTTYHSIFILKETILNKRMESNLD